MPALGDFDPSPTSRVLWGVGTRILNFDAAKLKYSKNFVFNYSVFLLTLYTGSHMFGARTPIGIKVNSILFTNYQIENKHTKVVINQHLSGQNKENNLYKFLRPLIADTHLAIILTNIAVVKVFL